MEMTDGTNKVSVTKGKENFSIGETIKGLTPTFIVIMGITLILALVLRYVGYRYGVLE